MADVFRFTDEQWRAYQAVPDQGYSHRHWIEHQVNSWLAEHDRQVAVDKQRRIDAVFAMHENDGTGWVTTGPGGIPIEYLDNCRRCQTSWPCSTVRALSTDTERTDHG